MTASAQFQLFPPPSPRTRGKKNPFRKGQKKDSASSRGASPSNEDKDVKNPGKSDAVIVQIIEDTDILAPPPAKTKPQSPEPELLPQASNAVSPPLNNQIPPPPPQHPASPEDPPAVASSNNEALPGPPKSPVAIRSMFPVYNPALPLWQQNYYPQRAGAYNAPRGTVSHQSSPVPSPPSNFDIAPGGPKTVPASIVNFPPGVLDPVETGYSSNQDLEQLWEAANGQGQTTSLRVFNLKLSKTQPGTFTFGSRSTPFYTLQTFSTNELGISRSHPGKPNTQCSIMTLDLEEFFGRRPSSGGLVAELFPELAGMLATEQAAELSKTHNLPPTVALEVESNAVNRAVEQESCRLFRDESMRRYELQHPALDKTRNHNQIGEDGLPRSPVQTREPGTLHINISAPRGTETTSSQPPTIIVTAPSLPGEGAACLPASPRTSTLPLSDTDEPLATLDLGTNTLSLSPGLISATVPSLYAIDALVSAVLAVAVTDETTNPILANMKLSVPGEDDIPASPQPQRVSTDHSVATTTQTKTYTGNLFATLAEREDAKQEEQLMSQVRKPRWKSIAKFKGKEIPEPSSPYSAPDPKTKHKSKKKLKKKQIVIEEFDIEDYRRYGSRSSREGEKLPGITRSLVRVLFWLLRFIVWGITFIAKSIARILVGVTTCVTSDKF